MIDRSLQEERERRQHGLTFGPTRLAGYAGYGPDLRNDLQWFTGFR
jgi:hypothetical protein